MSEIIICEDSEKIRNRLQISVEKHLQENNYIMSLGLVTPKPLEVLEHIGKNDAKRIYFLDVELGADINGIELAKKIREVDSEGVIIFVTAYSKYASLTYKYKLNVWDYIEKETIAYTAKKVCECLDTLHEKTLQKSDEAAKILTVISRNREYHLKHEDILYFTYDSEYREVTVHLRSRQKLGFNGKMDDLEKIGSNFYRTNRATIVNKDHIKSIDGRKGLLHLLGDEKCDISVRKLKVLRDERKAME
ncbi:MAG: LytTR family DNA-binding domain-containing protein [Turicibacter sp.]|nr:LytTR family DNA-binding domain-containing protein [Turicibacter sp.]